MENPQFICPTVTAFDNNLNIDAATNRQLWDRLITGGVDGILVAGSIGEFFALAYEQKLELIKLAAQHINGRVELLAGTGMNSLPETIKLSNAALEAGADAVALITPYYFTLGEEALFDYYAACAQAINGKILLYNFPARTGNDIGPELLRRLVDEFPNIVGIKDTVTELSHTRALIQAVRPRHPDFRFLAGFDENFYYTLLSGGNGAISGLANVYPEVTAAWVRAAREGNAATLERMQELMNHLANIYTIAPVFVPVIKEAIRQRGVALSTVCRATPTGLTAAEKDAVTALLARADELIAATDLPSTGIPALPSTDL
ncbi:MULTISPECIES: dihydrodipicolinate synthase family protein [Actinotignum]|uniref:Dihydrodipicolinate synthase family protein n=1 Tax=Actinotignum timonense TaxID=1870995 RepID=A0AAW9HBQ4_9ACTO|nr:dihydrodipicolinate synthase family protein [Actinotignum timonense]MDY5129972.1 dihydrodipicolinate synthase family protein [Actinotignum timonense]MDY5140520.1 dihydrodipicolinate synthase family protein [Actinotignum timonense]MDY5156436.1 dihydrodipicolinate synthase family protein [Actinotignum timonense]